MAPDSPPGDVRRTIDTIWRMEQAKVIASIAKMVRDVGTAEELAQDALVMALEKWPTDGIPAKPAAWLTQVAKRRALDRMRHRKMAAQKHAEIGRALEEQQDAVPDYDSVLDDDIGDELLALLFTACHPVLPPEQRIALTLRVMGGLTTEEIARAFLVPEPTMAQRIVRAKRALADARVPFVVPTGLDRAARLGSVLEVLYLVFNEGYTASAGDDWMRPALCEEALRLGRVLAELAPQEPEVHGLVALMEIQASRTPARVGADGEPVLLLEQNRARWDRMLIGRGLAALERAHKLGRAPGPYALQAEIAACHARAAQAADTDWARIAALYDALAVRTPSPVVELNRAVAHSMAFGPAAGLALVEPLRSEPALAHYHLLPAVRADLLHKLGRLAEARVEYELAAAMTRNERERALLGAKAKACAN